MSCALYPWSWSACGLRQPNDLQLLIALDFVKVRTGRETLSRASTVERAAFFWSEELQEFSIAAGHAHGRSDCAYRPTRSSEA